MLKNQLEKIQNSDEQTKKKWLIIMSGISMLIIIIIWLFYMTSLVSNTAQSETQTDNSGTGFWQIFKTGLTVIGNNVEEKAGNVISKIGDKIPFLDSEKKITIQTPQ